MSLKRIWVEEKLANSLKSMAAKSGKSMVELSEELADAETEMQTLLDSLNRRKKNAVRWVY